MHILIVNDDGPSSKSSPIITTFVATLENAGHTISVVLSHVTRSWMSKAHIRNVTFEPEYYVPEGQNANNSPPSRWTIASCSPAGCVQLGSFHLFPQLSPVGIIISGPSYGRNVTSISNLCSGTLGAAMEAALCRRKSYSTVVFLFQDRKP
ncbi:hypothetical protein N7G274_005570 [Stereocaulon virgatum]|uniref:Survival protein SurE-like phosphatase/nucleotidase domain-containing protein n=1 Tax=Stereocaulon virgatum TaxID=373712 RepID=A0ABR4A8P6_9LECA